MKISGVFLTIFPISLKTVFEGQIMILVAAKTQRRVLKYSLLKAMELGNQVRVFCVWNERSISLCMTLTWNLPTSEPQGLDFVESTQGIDFSLWNGLYLKLVILFYKEMEAFSFYASVA